jgi:Ca2+-binding EF-hand superfamily protein
MSVFARFTLAAALASAALPAAGIAATAQAGHRLQAADTNGDGRVSLDEYVAAAVRRFDAVDTGHRGSVDAAAIASSPAAISRLDGRADRLVRKLDTAGNGYVTEAEFVIAAQNRFTRLDRNGDGRLTADELTPEHGARRGPHADERAREHADRLDADHDGVVTAAEFSAAAKAKYAALDVRHDGKVTAADLAASAHAQRRALRAAQRIVARVDANGDGAISKDEAVAAARQRFARLDRNGDGFIDADEASAAHRGRRKT